MYRSLLLIVFVFINTISLAQYTEQDSLKLIELYNQIFVNNPDSIATISHKILKKIKEPKQKTLAYEVLGNYHRFLSNDSAIYYAEKTINILKDKTNTVYQERIAISYKLLGDIYRHQGLFDKSLDYYLKGLEISQKLHIEDYIVAIRGSIASIYFHKKEYDIATTIYEDIISKYSGSDRVSYYSIYISLGNIELAKNNKEKSIEYYNKALKICQEKENIVCIADIYNNLGVVNTEFDKKVANYKKAISLYEEYDFEVDLLNSIYNLGLVYRDEKKYEKSIEYFDKALDISKKDNDFEVEQLIYDDLYILYNEKEDYKQSIHYLKKSYGALLKIDSLQQDKDYNELRVKYETSEKENEVSTLREQQLVNENKIDRQNIIKWSILIGFIIILIPIFFLLYTYYQRMITQQKLNDKLVEFNQQKIAGLIKDQELKLIKTSLDAIDDERKRIAQRLHDSVGGNLSSIKLQLDNISDKSISYKKLVDQIDDTYNLVREISHNLIPHKFSQNPFTSLIKEYMINVQSSNNLEITFNAYPEDKLNGIDQKLQVELYSIIQELLTNVLKHAKASKISIQLDQLQNKVTLFFEDNGIGFETRKISLGIGLESINSRLKHFNGEMTIDSKLNRGTLVNIDIPLFEKPY